MKSKFALLICAVGLAAVMSPDCLAGDGHGKKSQRDTTLYPDSYLDTVQVDTKFRINDYSTLGFEYGISRNDATFNPKYKTGAVWNKGYYSILYTIYGKMFGYMPYFGLRFGVNYATEAFAFAEYPETHKIATLYGDCVAEKMHIIEVPVLAHLHMDFQHFKVYGDVGIYGAYRMDIERTGLDGAVPADQYNFKTFEYRFDYGLHGGLGFGIVFSPFELQFNVRARYSWAGLFEPNFQSEYYYRFGYPFDLIGTVGIHYQLTRRTGKTRRMLKREAYQAVYDPPTTQSNQNVPAN